jgi:transposase
MTALLLGGALLASGATRADQPVAPGCAKIVAALDESGGTMSADEIAKKTSTDVETVRSCTDQWRAGMKGPKGTANKQAAMPPGCAKVVDVLDQNPGLSADEVAKKSSVDVETVRNCTDLWRKTMPQ